MSHDAVDAWHALLANDAGLAEASAAQLATELERAGLHFGTRALCTVLRPRFFSPAEYEALVVRVRAVMRAFDAAYARAIADPAARAQFRLAEWEETLVAGDAGRLPPSPTSRLDAFLLADGGMSLTEYNAETPAGAFYNDALAEAFMSLPVSRAFQGAWSMQALPARHGVVRALLDAWEAWRGTRERPRIAILDWAEVPTMSEFRIARAHFEARGLECIIGDPRECELRGGRLLVRGTPVDLVYKRVLLAELVEREGLDNVVIRAVREGAVCLVNGFRSKILHKKASLAVLSDERNAGWYDAAMQAAIAAHVPWTRVVEARSTVSPAGTPIDLLGWAATNREHLVLKPNDDYGGKGIVLGWTVDQAEWEAALGRAVEEPTIVQERVSIPREPFPSLVDGTVQFIPRQVDTAPYICHASAVDGVLSRLSTAELLNVTAGGGSQTPTMLVERR